VRVSYAYHSVYALWYGVAAMLAIETVVLQPLEQRGSHRVPDK
jgi:hypothetical protein